jgi:DNA-binding HxlR family transcriptional regulator
LTKNQEITTQDELLQCVEGKRIDDSYPAFSSSFRKTSAGEIKLGVQIGREKLSFDVRPVLRPNRRLLRADRPGKEELLLCAHIAEPLALDLRKEGIPHADLNGRLFLYRPGALVDIRPGETRYRNRRDGPDVFSPKAVRIIRNLLSERDVLVTQEELSRTGVSRALVSQVLRQLVEDGLVAQVSTSNPDNPAYYRLADFDRLLDGWRQADKWTERVVVHQYSVLASDAGSIARKLLAAVEGKDPYEAANDKPIAFTQWFAAWQRRPHTTPPVVSCYIKKPWVLDAGLGRKVKSGGNLWLIEPADEGVWQSGRVVDGFPLVSDAQIYLDLLKMGQRGPETAEEFRKWEGFSV